MTFPTKNFSYQENEKEKKRLFSLLKESVPSDLLTERQDLIYDYRNQDQTWEDQHRKLERELRFQRKENQTKRELNLEKLVKLSGLTREEVCKATGFDG